MLHARHHEQRDIDQGTGGREGWDHAGQRREKNHGEEQNTDRTGGQACPAARCHACSALDIGSHGRTSDEGASHAARAVGVERAIEMLDITFLIDEPCLSGDADQCAGRIKEIHKQD